jgi:hypothetical protein
MEIYSLLGVAIDVYSKDNEINSRDHTRTKLEDDTASNYIFSVKK